MGRGHVRVDRHRRHDHRAAGAVLYESGPDSGRNSDHRHPDPGGKSGERCPFAVAVALGVTDGIAFGNADVVGVRALVQPATRHSRRSPFERTISSSGTVMSAIDALLVLTRISITSARRRRAVSAQSRRNVKTTGRTRFMT